MRVLTFILLCMSVAAHAEGTWVTNDVGYVVTQADETNDFLGINICTKFLVFATASTPEQEGKSGKIPVKIRIDLEEPWEGELDYAISDGMAQAGITLDAGLLSEMIKGNYLRVKWGINRDIYSRFNLTGLTATLKNVKCDRDFFNDKKDADFFL